LKLDDSWIASINSSNLWRLNLFSSTPSQDKVTDDMPDYETEPEKWRQLLKNLHKLLRHKKLSWL